jgi:hypothetical protein
MTQLDAPFGHLKTVRVQRERRKLERRSIADLLEAMADVEATHVIHVELDKSAESRFYKTAMGSRRAASGRGGRGAIEGPARFTRCTETADPGCDQ